MQRFIRWVNRGRKVGHQSQTRLDQRLWGDVRRLRARVCGPRSRQFLLWSGLALWITLALPTLTVLLPLATPVVAQAEFSPLPIANDAETQARDRFTAGQYAAAGELFEQATTAENDPWRRAALWANASLAYQRAGDWSAAEAAIAQAQTQMDIAQAMTDEQPAIAAQVQDIAAQWLLSQGRPEEAAITWEAAVSAYARGNATVQGQQAQLRQAQALQAAGFYRRSVNLLSTLTASLAAQPASPLAVDAYLSLGEALRLTGAFAEAETQFQQGLELAQSLGLADRASAAYRGLGDTARSHRAAVASEQAALTYYDQAIATAVSPLPRFRAQLAQLRLWVDGGDWHNAYNQVDSLWNAQTELPSGRSTLYARIEFLKQLQRLRGALVAVLADANVVPEASWYDFVREVLGESLNTLRAETTSTYSRSPRDNPLWYVIDKQFPPLTEMATQLSTLRQETQALGDVQAEVTILGVLGSLYAQVEEPETAAQLTQEGLVLAQTYGLNQVAYELQAQLGEIQLAQGDRPAAIDAYRASVETLQAMRADVVAVSSEAQYSFQQSIEPIYRELAALLLEGDAETTPTENLKQAREVIELLQLAELDNFFREACLSAETVAIDQLDTRAAVLYPILLPGRLDVVVSLPNDEFRHFPVSVDADTLNETLSTLRRGLINPPGVVRGGIGVEGTEGSVRSPRDDRGDAILLPAAQLYDWLIRPAEAALADSDAQTLVFVLDGGLRNIPMSVLYDGNQFLVEKYAIALTPGLRLLDPQPLPKQSLSVIAAGVSRVGPSSELKNFAPLPHVLEEVNTIQEYFPSTVLLDEDFSVDNFEAQVGTVSSPIVHLATHGQFGSDLENTFVITWEDSLDANRFSNILLTSELSRENPIELLVLSACETARGDNLAVLGLAGIAMRSGARSTLASLWKVSDAATARLMGEFYRFLGDPQLTKAEAIRQAQLSLLQTPEYQHPYYWSAMVMVGNWL